ncbi:hypothetical protein [Escherichia coli]|nr:hypothetical protein [Escherichia coli]
MSIFRIHLDGNKQA